MRAVIDTNVLVAALINPEGTPARVIDEIRAQTLRPVLGQAILEEYRAVLTRPHFGFSPDTVDDLIEDMVALALSMSPAKLDASILPDPDDAPFIATALAAACPIVTGNSRHFPPECGVEILTPAQCPSRLFTE